MRNKLVTFRRKTAAVHRRSSTVVKRLSRHPVAVPFFTFAFLLVVSAAAYWYFTRGGAPVRNAQVVIINYDGVEQTVPSIEPTVGALLKKLQIDLAQGDVVEPALVTPINQDDFRINVYRAVPVQIVDDGSKTYAFSAATTPRAIARQTGASLFAEDIVTAEPVTNFIEQGAIGEQVTITRSIPVTLNLYGTPEPIRTHAKTVKELIERKGIKISSSDQVLPAPQTPIAANQQIFIAREGTRLETITEEIPMPIETIIDQNLAYGTSAVRQQGSDGQRVVTYQADANNPKNRSIIQSIVTREPVTQIVVQGASLSGVKGDMARAGIAPGDFNYVDYIVQKESGWNPAARNPTSGAFGLCQALPGTKMASAGSDWSTNPVTQLRWCDGYAKGRYGSWAKAHSFWLSHRWW